MKPGIDSSGKNKPFPYFFANAEVLCCASAFFLPGLLQLINSHRIFTIYNKDKYGIT